MIERKPNSVEKRQKKPNSAKMKTEKAQFCKKTP